MVGRQVSSQPGSMKAAFVKWLSTGEANVSTQNLVTSMIDTLSMYTVSRNISSSVWELSDESEFHIAYQRVLDDWAPKLIAINRYNAYIVSGRVYLKFLKEKPWELEDGQQPHSDPIICSIMEPTKEVILQTNDACIVTELSTNGSTKQNAVVVASSLAKDATADEPDLVENVTVAESALINEAVVKPGLPEEGVVAESFDVSLADDLAHVLPASMKDAFLAWSASGTHKKYSGKFLADSIDVMSNYAVSRKVSGNLWEITRPGAFQIAYTKLLGSTTRALGEEDTFKAFKVAGLL